MDIQLEKDLLIERLKQVNDESLIQALKSMLDYAGNKGEVDHLLEESIDRGLYQSDKGIGRPHKQVMADIREKFKK